MTVRLTAPRPGGSLPAVDPQRLEKRARELLRAVDRAHAELSVRLADDTEIAELNERWRGRKGATDVLSFSLLEGDHVAHHGELLGDVVIGLAVAERQARELGHSLGEELDRLLIHGLLHLLGHDHEKPEEPRRMQAEEERLQGVLGG